MIDQFLANLLWRRITRQVFALRVIAVMSGVLGPLAFLPVGHTPVEVLLGAGAVLAALTSGFAPGTPVVTLALLLFAGQVVTTADSRSQGMVLVLALAGTTVLWGQHMLWSVVNAVPADAAVQPGALRVVAQRAAAVLAVALLIDVVVLSAADAARASSSWRWAGFACVAVLLLTSMVLVLRRRAESLRGPGSTDRA